MEPHIITITPTTTRPGRMDTLRRIRDDARRRLISAAEDVALRSVAKSTHIPLSQVQLYRQVTGWAHTVGPGQSRVFTVPANLDGEDAAFLIGAGLHQGFRIVYVAHNRRLLVTKDPSVFTATPHIVGKTQIVD